MKLDKLKDLDIKFDDPYDIFYGNGKKKKRKDKKKKGKDDSLKSGSFKESLKEMGKKELAQMAEKMGIDLDFVDRQDKKAMRKAILKAHKDAKKIGDAKGAVKMGSDSKEKPKTLGLQISADNAPPFYFDEETRDFVIREADDTEDMNCFNAMKSLGKIRKHKRTDDGFGTLMDKLQTLIERGMLDEKKDEPIEVPYTVVDTDAIPAAQDAIGLSADEVQQLDKDLSKALNARKK